MECRGGEKERCIGHVSVWRRQAENQRYVFAGWHHWGVPHEVPRPVDALDFRRSGRTSHAQLSQWEGYGRPVAKPWRSFQDILGFLAADPSARVGAWTQTGCPLS